MIRLTSWLTPLIKASASHQYEICFFLIASKPWHRATLFYNQCGILAMVSTRPACHMGWTHECSIQKNYVQVVGGLLCGTTIIGQFGDHHPILFMCCKTREKNMSWNHQPETHWPTGHVRLSVSSWFKHSDPVSCFLLRSCQTSQHRRSKETCFKIDTLVEMSCK